MCWKWSVIGRILLSSCLVVCDAEMRKMQTLRRRACAWPCTDICALSDD